MPPRSARGGDGENGQIIDLAPFLTRLCHDRGAGFASDLTLEVSARPVALGRAIGNLIDIALRYCGSAHVGLARDDDAAVITIDDAGPGIAPQRLDTVFAAFVRGEDSRSATTGGAGFGLSIARNIVGANAPAGPPCP